MYAYPPMTVCTYYTHCVALQQDTVRGSNLETWEICVSSPLELLQLGGFCRNLFTIISLTGLFHWETLTNLHLIRRLARQKLRGKASPYPLSI